jgi:hypothetical protein
MPSPNPYIVARIALLKCALRGGTGARHGEDGRRAQAAMPGLDGAGFVGAGSGSDGSSGDGPSGGGTSGGGRSGGGGDNADVGPRTDCNNAFQRSGETPDLNRTTCRP